jgi:hypothetical protein
MESEPSSSFLFEHDLFRKPVSTFRDHALCLSMIFSDLPSPADLPSPKRSRFGFAQAGAGFALGSGLWPARAQAPAGNRFPLSGIML